MATRTNCGANSSNILPAAHAPEQIHGSNATTMSIHTSSERIVRGGSRISPRLLATLFAVLTAGLIGGCGDTVSNNHFERSTLDREYTFVVGVLVPDSARNYSQEIFVGTIRPNDNPPAAPLGGDSLVNRVLRTVRYEYVAEILPGPDAVVTIANGNGEAIRLEPIGNGFYRDTQNRLSVRNGERFRLNVDQDGTLYTAETTVPPAFHINGLSDGDTVSVPYDHVPSQTDPIPFLHLSWTASPGSFFYRIAALRSDVPYATLDHTFEPDDSGLAFPLEKGAGRLSRTVLTIEAPDTNYAMIYVPNTTFTYSDAWEMWYNGQAAKKLGERSSVSGKNQPAGVFGSAAVSSVTFTASAK